MSRVSVMLLAGVLWGLAGLSCNAEAPSAAPAREEARDAGTPPTASPAATPRDEASDEGDFPEARWPGPPDDLGEDTFVCDFNERITPSELLSGAEVRYPPEALKARVRGLVIARCTLTREGRVEDCRIIKGLPHMDEAVVQALQSRRYRPVTFRGKPVTVKYTFHMKLQAP